MKNVLLTFAIIALIAAFINISVTLTKLADIKTAFTGFTGQYGFVNLTIVSVVSINFSDDFINWSSGSVSGGKLFAWLYSNGTVADGNWTPETTGFNITNIGTINATLKIATGNPATTFIGGTSPNYTWNMSQIEANSCMGVVNLSNAGVGYTYFDVNSTSPGTLFCSNFSYNDNYDEVRLDIGVKVPYDASGTKTDTITATAAIAV